MDLREHKCSDHSHPLSLKPISLGSIHGLIYFKSSEESIKPIQKWGMGMRGQKLNSGRWRYKDGSQTDTGREPERRAQQGK